MKKLLVLACLTIIVFSSHAQFLQNQLPPLSAESFRTGVEAYNLNRYGEALAQFERALTFAERDPLALYWLGKAYYKMGLSDSAFRHWREASLAANGSPFVDSRLELAGAMEDPEGLKPASHYARVTELTGQKGKNKYFLRPSWIEPLKNGSMYVVSHGSNELLLIDANGRILKNINGGTSGFDRPFACTVLDDGTIFLSEFQSNRIVKLSAEGKILSYFGSDGGTKSLVGPQYLTADKDGFIYVVDSGFARVVKYDKDGKRLLSFGNSTAFFDGFVIPTGIALANNSIYVADMFRKTIYIFDFYGNFREKLDISSLHSPEGLRIIDDRYLLIADSDRILQIDLSDLSETELYHSERKKPRIISAAYDANGELVAADFDASEIVYLSDFESRFSGLYVDIEKIHSDSFPEISFELKVRDRRGRAISGLNLSNFYATEGITVREKTIEGDKAVNHLFSSINSISSLVFEGSLDYVNDIDYIFLLEVSRKNLANRAFINETVASIMNASGPSSNGRLLEAGKTAQAASAPGIAAMTSAIYKAEADENWRFDSGLKLAAISLFGSNKRKAIVYIGSGEINTAMSAASTISELAMLLYQNDIALYSVVGSKDKAPKELEYLCSKSGGQILYANSPAGFNSIPQSILSRNTGRYLLSFRSEAADGFGKSYIPLSLEVYLRDRSGKDESGFFAALR